MKNILICHIVLSVCIHVSLCKADDSQLGFTFNMTVDNDIFIELYAQTVRANINVTTATAITVNEKDGFLFNS